MWTPIASLTLTTDWQLLVSTTIEGEVFRISQNWDIYPASFKGLIATSFNIPYEIYNVRSFYPSTNKKIIQFLIPAELQQAGINARYILMKYYSRRQFTAAWTITLDKFVNGTT